MNPIRKTLLVMAASVASALSAAAQAPFAQWDFGGDLNGTVGDPLTYIGDTQSVTSFGTTTSFGIADIGGAEATVMKFPMAAIGQGYNMPTPDPNGSATALDVNIWTIILDVLIPAESYGSQIALIDNNDSQTVGTTTRGAEFGIGPNGGVFGFGSQEDGAGLITADTWHRIIFTVEYSDVDATVTVAKYIDGTQVGKVTNNVNSADESAWTLLTVSPGVRLFSEGVDVTGEPNTAAGYVSSVQVRDIAISQGQAVALGGPDAAGIPQDLPEVPSFVESFTPAGSFFGKEFAGRNTDLAAVINQGDTVVDQGSVRLFLDGSQLSGVNVSVAGGLITAFFDRTELFVPESTHTLEVRYMDNKIAGEQSFSTEFKTPVFYEDFDAVELGPNVDDVAPAGEWEMAWTRNGPEGWLVDTTGVPGDDSPDDDGDGWPDNDGVTEWAGWSFANIEFWQAADGQRRSEFTLAGGNVLVADPDEWDDKEHADSAENGWYETWVDTPAIPLDGVALDGLFLQFDSSWRPEFDDNYHQSGEITVSWDGGAREQILLWLSDPSSPNFKDDNSTNDRIILPLSAPAGATSMQLRFRMFDAGNDWWWAVDNVVVSAGDTPPIIEVEPASTEVEQGEGVTFSVAVGGTAPFTYQWFKGGEPIEGATGAEYTIASTTPADAGTYTVEVTNGVGTATSAGATLKILLKLGAVIFSENFDSVELGPNVNETVADDTAFTHTPPAGWTVDNSAQSGFGDDATDGVTEWAGWSFADPSFWSTVDGQRRGEFTKASGAAAIADGDEWDDQPHSDPSMTTFLISPSIDISGIAPGSAVLKFDSSWRPDATQTAVGTVSFDGGEKVEIFRFESDSSSPNYKDDNSTNDTLTFAIDNPEGAQSMVIEFGYIEAGNFWWWAIDNIVVTGEFPPLWAEDFEGLTLGASVDEEVAADNVWTDMPPAGWSIDDSTVVGGVTEWAGWSFADKDWYAQTAGDQGRAEFTKGMGIVAVADGDEWADLAHEGYLSTFMSTGPINVSGQAANTLFLKFDSGWRPEYDSDYHQTANITVSYDGGDPVEVLRWESDESSANYHGDNRNETVTIPLNNPGDAGELVITFGYFDAGNDWYWVIDNLEVNIGSAPELPIVVAQPVKQIISEGGNAVLSVGAEGPDLQYQWFLNGVAIEGATGPELAINIAKAADAGDYSVEVSNGSGSVSSDTVSIEVFSGAVTDDLIVHLPFDGNADDASGRGNNGTPEGTLAYIAGPVGQSVSASFNGDNSVSLGTPADLNFGTDTDFSVSFWVKYTTTSGDPGFLGNKDWGSGGNQGYVFAVSGDGIKWNIGDGAGNRADSSGLGVLNDGNWHHYAASFDRDGFGTAYIDGVAAGLPVSIANVGNIDTPAGLATIVGDDGTGAYGSPGSQEIQDAEMDELGIWRRVLTADEVWALYVAGAAGAELSQAEVGNNQEGAVAGQWDFDQGDLTATVGGDMTYYDGVDGATAQATSFLTMPINGEDANVMMFAAAVGEMGYLAPAGRANGGIGATKKNQYSLIFDIQWPAAADGTWRSFGQIDALDNTNDGEFFVNTSNGIGISGNYTGEIMPGTWHRVVFTVDQRPGVNTITKYIDGELVGEQGAGGFDGRWGLLDMVNLLSDNSPDEVHAGYVNSIQIRNEVLTPDQVASIGGASAAGIPLEIGDGSGPVLGIAVGAGNVTIMWDSPDAILQWTPVIGGTWMNVDGATSPYSPDTSAGEGYFRLVR